MKKKMIMIMALCLLLAMCLWGYSAEEVPAPETTVVQTEATTVPTEPVTVPTEPEKIEELVFEERYQILVEENSNYYTCPLVIYPNSCFDWFNQNTYEVDGDRITFAIEGEQCTFRRTENSLILESGRLLAHKGDTAVQVPIGTETRYKEEMKIRDGIYVLDTSEYDFTFDEVLMDIDLTEMTFTLKCFDGSVVSGILSFEEDKLVCSHETGEIWFRIVDTIRGNQGTLELYSTTVSYAKGGSTPADQLMICPQTDIRLEYTFVYADDRDEEIIADPDIVPLDSYKHAYREYYSFYGEIEDQGETVSCGLGIYFYPMQEKWSFSFSAKSIEVDYAENPDGTITLSHNGKHWNFRWEGDDLYFDGGDTLIADNGVEPKESYYRKMEVPVGAALYHRNTDYVYDALYILPANTLEECYAAIQLDTKNQWIKSQCYDGKVLRGPYTIGENGTYLQCQFEIPDYVGTRTAYINLSPSGHVLGVGNQWMLNIGPGDPNSYDYFYFFPVQGVTPQEAIEE